MKQDKQDVQIKIFAKEISLNLKHQLLPGITSRKQATFLTDYLFEHYEKLFPELFGGKHK